MRTTPRTRGYDTDRLVCSEGKKTWASGHHRLLSRPGRGTNATKQYIQEALDNPLLGEPGHE